MNVKRRLVALERSLNGRRLDGFLVTGETNVSYLSGFSGHDAVLLFTGKDNFCITDSRYIEEARKTLKYFKAVLVERSMYEAINSIIKKRHIARVGFESMNLQYGAAKKLFSVITGAKLVPTKGVVEEIRSVKDPSEIARIKASVRLTVSVMGKLSGQIKPGASETEVAQAAEMMFIEKGARPSFDPIVAVGVNSSMPHARPGPARIPKDGAVMVDIGCRLNGYCSDITRMLFSGRVAKRFKRIYQIVASAQRYAIDRIKAGVEISSIDGAARGYITKKGYGKRFAHSLGHGVGMEVHEDPSVSPGSEGRLKKGMVFTVEPAIYIPNFGGVRVEDMVLVSDDGCEVLTK